VTARVVLTGSVSDFDDAARAAIAASVAAEVGVTPNQVSVFVEAASVKLSIIVDYDNQPDASAASETLKTALNADSTTIIGGLSSIVSFSVGISAEGAAPPWSPPPPPQQPPTGSRPYSVLLGVICGILGAVLLGTPLTMFLLKRRRGKVGTSPVVVTPPAMPRQASADVEKPPENVLRKRSSQSLVESIRQQASKESLQVVSMVSASWKP